MTIVVAARHVAKDYTVGKFPERRTFSAVADVSLSIGSGETLGIVGESGCGKSTLSRLVLGLEAPTRGEIQIGSETVARDGQLIKSRPRGLVQAVMQDPGSSLNPKLRISTIVTEPLKVTEPGLGRAELLERAGAALDLVGLDRSSLSKFPHQFSGGQKQRVAIARALVSNPRLIVLDEAISSLDVSVAAQVMNLLKGLQDRLGISYLFISHQLAAVMYMSHHVSVMYMGRIVETGTAAEIGRRPRHPYTHALLGAALPADIVQARAAKAVGGEVPDPLAPPSGCTFHSRCPRAIERCATVVPAWIARSPTHGLLCDVD